MKEVTSTNFKDTIDQAKKPAILEIFSPYCPVCKKLEPVYSELANTLNTEYEFLRANVIEHPEIAKHYNIRVAPAILFIKDGEMLGKVYGNQEKDLLIKKITEVFAS